MRISDAVQVEKDHNSWPEGPTSVGVCFVNREGYDDETELDLHGPDTEAELEGLWADLHEEMEAEIDSVTSVEAYGFIVK